jgi:3-oxoadipate enol-lactonase
MYSVYRMLDRRIEETGRLFMKRESFKVLVVCAVIFCAASLGCGRKDEPAEVETGFFETGTAKLYYEKAGSGRPVVMIHGGLLNASMWDDQFEEFARRYRVIRYDARGHGRSTSEPDTFSHHEDLRALVEGFALEKPVIIGLSMGGYVAIDFALEYPDLPGALVLVSPGLSGYEFKSREFIDFSNRIGVAAQSEDIEAIVEAFQTAWTDGPRRGPDEIDPTVREKVRAMVNENVERWDERNAEYRPLPLAIERLDGLSVPVLALVGNLDMPGIREIVELVESEALDARMVMMPGVAHMINMEKPDEFNRIVLEFLDALPPVPKK